MGLGPRPPETLPAETATLLLHLQDLAGKGKAASTIRTATSAVSAAHRAAGFRSGENPSANEDVRNFLRGIEREAPPQRQAAAMLPNVISAIRATARIPRTGRGGRTETKETAEARARVDVALALTLRDGGLRVSEAAVLAWKDVERWPDGSGRRGGRHPHLPAGLGRRPAGACRCGGPRFPTLNQADGQPDQGGLPCRRARGRRLLRSQRQGGTGPDDKRRRSSHRDHHAPGPVEVR